MKCHHVSFFAICCMVSVLISSVFSTDEMDTAPEIVFPDDKGKPDTYPSCDMKNKDTGECRPPTMCDTPQGRHDIFDECNIDTETKGVCCPFESLLESRMRSEPPSHMILLSPTYNNVRRALEKRSQAPSPAHKKMLKEAEKTAKDKMLGMEENLTRVIEEGDKIQPKSPAAWLDRFHKIPKHSMLQVEKGIKIAEMDLHVTQEMSLKLNEKKGRSLSGPSEKLSDFSVQGLEFRSGFQGNGDCRDEQIQCETRTKRRRYDGRCNNLENPTWGSAEMAYQRLADPAYEDGFNLPRVQHNGKPLSSARLVSALYSENAQELEDPEHTLMLAQFGQFLDHDLTSTPTAGTNGVECCTRRGKVQAKENAHRNCIPIEVGKNDAFYNAYGQQCLHMVRSAPAVRPDCVLGPREQLNTATAFIDASQIYGSDQTTARALRLGKGGRLRTSSTIIEKRVNNTGGFLPPEDAECESVPPRCTFDAGDVRANENMQLAVLHTVFLREHNRLAKILEKINPHWNDDTVFHEARRIVIAELQHITFNEFLPIVIGADYLNHHDMFPKKNADYTELYINTLDPTIFNVFPAAAFRFGHTLVPWDVSLADAEGQLTEYIHLKRSFFNPAGLYRNFDRFLHGMAKQNCRRFDPHIIPALTNQLFENEQGWGLDLLAINIQRGRDHGLPDYSQWVKICGGENITDNWEAMKTYMRPEAVDTLRRIYPAPQEIDLFVGALGEVPEGDALLGRTFACLVGNMFIRLRKGDRLFYEEKTAGFSKAQLNELRKTSLARILCDNSKGNRQIQPLVMREAKNTNQEVSCTSRSIPKLDLSRWKHIK